MPWYLRKDIGKFTSVILYMNIICIAQLLFDASFEIYTFLVRLQDVIKIVNQNALSCKHVSIILYRENMTSFLNYVTAMLRTLYAWRGSYIYTPMAFACNEAEEKCGIYFPMKDTGHVTKTIDIDFFDFLGGFHRFSINIRIEVH